MPKLLQLLEGFEGKEFFFPDLGIAVFHDGSVKIYGYFHIAFPLGLKGMDNTKIYI
jgi:hypothetical protein